MKLTRCAEHMSFIYAQGLRLALYKGLHATAARLVQKVVAETGSGNRALRVKLAKMINVPGVAHRNAIFGLKADSARPSDSFHPVRAFPYLARQRCLGNCSHEHLWGPSPFSVRQGAEVARRADRGEAHEQFTQLR